MTQTPGLAPPRTADLGDFLLEPLTPACAAEDFAAVTGSAGLLDGIFGDAWPRGLTWEANLADLDRHAREFDAGLAFAWVIRAPSGGYLGCAYINPPAKTGGAGVVHLWLRQEAATPEACAALRAAFGAFLRADCGPAADYPLHGPPVAG